MNPDGFCIPNCLTGCSVSYDCLNAGQDQGKDCFREYFVGRRKEMCDVFQQMPKWTYSPLAHYTPTARGGMPNATKKSVWASQWTRTVHEEKHTLTLFNTI